MIFKLKDSHPINTATPSDKKILSRESSVSSCPTIGKERSQVLFDLGIETLGDVLELSPNVKIKGINLENLKSRIKELLNQNSQV